MSDNPENPQPTHTTDQLTTGSTLLNRYLIESVLGVGGMGAVYRARDLHFPNVVKYVAVKEMVIQTRDPVIRSAIVKNFEREANLLATLDHPAIPSIYDYFTSHNRSYLVLEFINGKDLEDMMDEDYSISQVIHWAIEICDVLHYLHNHKPEPIIFRDMKPSNVMIDQFGKVKLIDFGIAKPFRSNQRGTMVGTEGYSPPEQYRGEASPLADIYSLGATLHHLLTKQDPRMEPPFSFGERPVHIYNPEISQELERIIHTALQYSPEDRYSNALQMKANLLDLLEPGTTKSPVAPDRSVTTNQDRDPLWTFPCADEIRGPITYANGLLYFGSYDANLYAVDCKTGKMIWKFTSDGGIVSKPVYSEDSIYFGSEDNRLYVISARNGKINWSYYTNGPIRSSPVIAAGHVFIGSDDCELHAVNISSGRHSWKVDAGAPIRSTPLIYGDGIFLGTQMGDYFCLDFRGSIRWRFKAKRAITSSGVADDGIIYFTSVDATLYALESKTGWLSWRYRLGKASISTPCFAREYIFTGAVDGIMYCVEAKSGKEVWQFPTQNQVTGSGVIDGDEIYFGSVDGNLYCLDVRTGKLSWRFQTGGPITGTPVIQNGIIYVGSTDKYLYALPISSQ